MASSTIPAAVDGLLALIRSGADADTKVIDGYPRFDLVDTDLITVGGTLDPTATGEQTSAALGARHRNETFSVQVVCFSSRGGDDQKAVRDRAFALMAVVETAVRANLTLAGAVRVAQVEGSIRLTQTSADEAPKGVFASVAFLVACESRI